MIIGDKMYENKPPKAKAVIKTFFDTPYSENFYSEMYKLRDQSFEVIQ